MVEEGRRLNNARVMSEDRENGGLGLELIHICSRIRDKLMTWLVQKLRDKKWPELGITEGQNSERIPKVVRRTKYGAINPN